MQVVELSGHRHSIGGLKPQDLHKVQHIASQLGEPHSRESPRSAWLEVLRNIDDNIDEKDFRAALDIRSLGVEAPA